MPNNYINNLYNQMRRKIYKTTKETELEILNIYKACGDDLVRKFRRSLEGSATRAYYASYIRSLNDEILSVIKKNGLKTAEIPVNLQRLMSEEIFKTAGIDKNVVKNFSQTYGQISRETVGRVISGELYKDKIKLSERIWGSSIRAGGEVQKIIASGLANKLSATQMANTLQAYVDPTVRKTWDKDKIRSVLGDGYANWNKNLEYNALRLARTTITHTAQMAHIDSCRLNPYIKSVQWHSVLQHDRTCDVCRERNGKIFALDDVPLDHPNGLCYQTAVLEKSLNNIADDLKQQVNNSSGEGSLLDLAGSLRDWVTAS